MSDDLDQRTDEEIVRALNAAFLEDIRDCDGYDHYSLIKAWRSGYEQAQAAAGKIPAALRRQLDYAIAAVRYGVTIEPGSPESATGVSAGQALAEADSFLAAFENWLGKPGTSEAPR